jgi:filamentous hemagglutinin
MQLNKTRLLFSMLALWGHSALVMAEIVPQNGTPDSVNQVPVVNINAPGADGVSHNRYSQFDVGTQGAILNNSATESHTALAGKVAGNNQLGGRGAAVILNEVNSSNKSVLNGLVEVAGQRADVVIANKAGITCNGCGFINARNGVLTTGELQFKNGAFSGYKVEQGNILVEGQGMKKGDVDYTAILARTETISASVHAESLLVSAGKKNISADLTQINPAAFSKDKPDVLIDVAELGGMYAGKIKLVATENGVGINSTGALVPVGLVNRGHIQAQQGGVAIAADALVNHGDIASTGQLGISTGLLQNNGRIQANNDVAIDAILLNNVGSLRAENGAMALRSNSLNNGAEISAERDMQLSTTQMNNSGSVQTAKGSLRLMAASVNNIGQIQAGQGLQLSATQLSNLGGIRTENGGLSILTTSLNNGGQVQSGGALHINSANVLNFSNGTLAAQDDVNIQGSSIDNFGRIVSRSSSVGFNSVRLYNRGEVEAAGDISSRGLLFSNPGSMVSSTGVVTHNGKAIKKPVH